jgi:peptidoglycan-associated lipoprotein
MPKCYFHPGTLMREIDMKKTLIICGVLLISACSKDNLLKTNPFLASKQSAKHYEMTKTVYFGFDQFYLTKENKAALDTSYQFIKENKIRSIKLAGHCDSIGTNIYNLKLGMQRAESVKAYLISKGFPQSKIKTKTYGEERLAVIGSDESSMKANRRVEITIR